MDRYRVDRYRVGVSDDIHLTAVWRIAVERIRLTMGPKIAVSEETVYVGKRDGHLLRSPDAGNTWKDLTPNLPLRFEHFNEIVFAGSTVYVATDTGVLTSADGEHWRAITDKTGTAHVIDRIAVADATIYGAGDKGVYNWITEIADGNRFLPEVSRYVSSFRLPLLTVTGFILRTEHRGMFHISLENEND